MNDLSHSDQLATLTDPERLAVYNIFTEVCTHLWSKNQPQPARIQRVLDTLVPLTKSDPYFLARLNAYVMKKSTLSDLQVISTFVNSLNSADGQPFSVGSKYKKPNLRYVSWAAIQMMDPKRVERVTELVHYKFEVDGTLNFSLHKARTLENAIRKYLKYRETDKKNIESIKKNGLGNILEYVYRGVHMNPSDEVAAILRWRQKGKEIVFNKPIFDFSGKTDLQIAEIIRKDKLPVLGVIGALPKMTPVIAVALLEQASGNQAVILTHAFEEAGILADPEVNKLYQEKISQAKNAVDRVEKIAHASEAVKQSLKEKRADIRKETVGNIGKVFMHIDFSPSMERAIEVAVEKGSLVAECVQHPEENFMWAGFDASPKKLKMPEAFVKDAFLAALFGEKISGGGTNVTANYAQARMFGADVDIIVSDGGHNFGDIADHIRRFHNEHPDIRKPKAAVHLVVASQMYGKDTEQIKRGYEANQIPVAVMDHTALDSSAGIAEAIRMAIKGPLQIIEDIMNEPLLELPKWFYTI